MSETVQNILIIAFTTAVTVWAYRSLRNQSRCCGGSGGCRCRHNETQ